MTRKSVSTLLFLSILATPIASASAEPPWDGYLDSTVYPIRVHYTTGAGVSKAQQALEFAEASWQIQVEQMGFAAPTTEDATGNRLPGLWIYLDPNAQYDHAEPIDNNPDTSWTDCTMRVVVASLSPVSYFESVVYHEMNHAMEMSDDCGESAFAFENTTMAITTLIWPEDFYFADYALPTFQDNPHRGLDCTFFMDQSLRYYHYGASLFQLFLEDRYGDYDGTLLSAIWRAARQDGNVTVAGYGITMDVPNSPNLLEAVVATLDGPSFDEVFTEFARWRYFVGMRDDGAHFVDGALWTGGEVFVDSVWTMNDLPLLDQIPASLPNEYGSVYMSLALDGVDSEHGVRFAITGDPTLNWNVDVLLVHADGTADVVPATMGDDGTAEVLLEDLVGYEDAVFIVSNLGDGTHSPNSPDCSAGATFSYDMEEVATALPPEVSSIDPNEVTTGAAHSLWIHGAGFADGAQVSFDSSDIQVTDVTFVDDTTLSVDITVSEGATPGPVAITITNPNGMFGTLADALQLQAPAQPDTNSNDGCGCASNPPESAPLPAAPLLWLLILLLATVRLRRTR